MSSSSARLIEVLEDLGLTIDEWDALRALEGGPLSLAAMAYAFRVWEPLTESLSILAASATEACLRKKWIKSLTAQECRDDRQRWESEDSECVSDKKYEEGELELSGEGAALFDEVWSRLGIDRYTEAVWWREDKRPCEITVFSKHPEPLERELSRFLDDPRRWGVNLVVEKLLGPYVIPSFWVGRFVPVGPGYRVDIVTTGR